MQIGQKLKEARVMRGMTQEDTAQALGVSRQTVSNWENERTYPDILSVVKLSELYGLTLDELLKDAALTEHLVQSTNTVRSNRRLFAMGAVNLAAVAIALMLLGDQGSLLLWGTLALEFLLLCVLEISDLPQIARPVKTIGRVFRLLGILLCFGLLALCLSAALDALRTGQTGTALRLFFTAILIAGSAAILFVRRQQKK